MRIERENSPAPGGTQTHNLFVMRRALYGCATTTPSCKTLIVKFKKTPFFLPDIASSNLNLINAIEEKVLKSSEVEMNLNKLE